MFIFVNRKFNIKNMNVCIYVCIYIHMYICVYVCMYVCTYVNYSYAS